MYKTSLEVLFLNPNEGGLYLTEAWVNMWYCRTHVRNYSTTWIGQVYLIWKSDLVVFVYTTKIRDDHDSLTRTYWTDKDIEPSLDFQDVFVNECDAQFFFIMYIYIYIFVRNSLHFYFVLGLRLIVLSAVTLTLRVWLTSFRHVWPFHLMEFVICHETWSPLVLCSREFLPSCQGRHHELWNSWSTKTLHMSLVFFFFEMCDGVNPVKCPKTEYRYWWISSTPILLIGLIVHTLFQYFSDSDTCTDVIDTLSSILFGFDSISRRKSQSLTIGWEFGVYRRRRPLRTRVVTWTTCSVRDSWRINVKDQENTHCISSLWNHIRQEYLVSDKVTSVEVQISPDRNHWRSADSRLEFHWKFVKSRKLLGVKISVEEVCCPVRDLSSSSIWSWKETISRSSHSFVW